MKRIESGFLFFDGYDFTDMEKRSDLTDGNRLMLAIENSFYISYLENGGEIKLKSHPDNLPYSWFNPATGEIIESGISGNQTVFRAPDSKPWVLIIGEKKW